MKEYINSLFPYRWIPIVILIGVMSFMILLMRYDNSKQYTIILLIINFVYWFVNDYFFGIGQPCLWDRKKIKIKNGK